MNAAGQVLVFLLESIGLTFLIGLVPPLRVAWYVAAALGVLLVVYVWLLLTIKHRASHPPRRARAPAPEPQAAARAGAVAALRGRGTQHWARPTFNGLGTLGESDRVHVVVQPREAAAGA